MSTATSTIEEFANKDYEWGFVTDLEADTIPKGLNEDIVRLLSAKKNEPNFLLEWRLKAYRHWLTMPEPRWWPNLSFGKIDYQNLFYYSAPKAEKHADAEQPRRGRLRNCGTFRKLGISLDEQKRLSGVAVDAVFD